MMTPHPLAGPVIGTGALARTLALAGRLAAALLGGCASSTDPRPTGEAGTGDGSPDAGESASSPSLVDSGADAAHDRPTETPARSEWVVLDDCDGGGLFPVLWNGGACAEPPAPRPRSGQALHFLREAATGDADELTTHHHFDWTHSFSAVRFWARSTGGRPLDLIVALTEIGPQHLRRDREEGRAWQGKAVTIGSDWQLYSVAWDQLAPLSAGTPVPMFGPAGSGGPGTAIHFVFPDEPAIDVWLDDLQLRGRPGVLP